MSYARFHPEQESKEWSEIVIWSDELPIMEPRFNVGEVQITFDRLAGDDYFTS